MPRRVLSKLRFFSNPRGLLGTALLAWSVAAQSAASTMTGTASWYGEAHRGKLMANGKAFNPDELTAASWFYPLETRLLVTCKTANREVKSVMVTVTDRGPAHRLVKNGRVIDLSHAAFERLAPPAVGLIEVNVYPEPRDERDTARGVTSPCQQNAPLCYQAQFCALQSPQEPAHAGVRATVGVEKKLP